MAGGFDEPLEFLRARRHSRSVSFLSLRPDCADTTFSLAGLDLPALPSPSWPDEDLLAAQPFDAASDSTLSTFPFATTDPTLVETDFWLLNHMHEMWGAHELAGPSF